MQGVVIPSQKDFSQRLLEILSSPVVFFGLLGILLTLSTITIIKRIERVPNHLDPSLLDNPSDLDLEDLEKTIANIEQSDHNAINIDHKPSFILFSHLTDHEQSKSKIINPPWYSFFIIPVFVILKQILYPPLIRRISDSKLMEHPLRRYIVVILKNREFEYFHSLKRLTNCSVSVLLWHLRLLADAKLIKISIINSRKIYSLPNMSIDHYKVTLYCSIRTQSALGVGNCFLSHDSHIWTVSKIAKYLSLQYNSVNHHCQKFTSLGLIEYISESKGYRLIPEKKEYLDWLINRYSMNSLAYEEANLSAVIDH